MDHSKTIKITWDPSAADAEANEEEDDNDDEEKKAPVKWGRGNIDE